MLDLYYQYPKVLKRLRSGTLGDGMDRIAAGLSELGYKASSAKIWLWRLARFSRFCDRVVHGRSAKIDPDVIQRFLKSRRTTSARISSQTAIGHAVQMLPERFTSACRQKLTAPEEPLLTAYAQHLQQVRGLDPKTCEGLILTARRMLTWYQQRRPGEPLSTMVGEDVLASVHYFLSLYTSEGTRSKVPYYIRSFLRFLRWNGLNENDLARFVPRPAHWRMAHLPPRLPWEEVNRAIKAVDVTNPVGKRDRALLLLLATTGLRNKELRLLELQDIRWRVGEVLVRRTKSHRDRLVPLLPEVGAALSNYVLDARPKIASTRVFLCHTPPVRPLDNSAIVARIVRRRLKQSGLELSRGGAHLVRHSLATQLVSQKRPIKEVADLLGHANIDTTALYVKVALPQLATVALPFPRGDA